MGIFTKKGRPFRDELTNFKKIGEWFIAPILAYKPEVVPEPVFLDWAFHAEQRVSIRYTAASAFKIPGFDIEVPNVPVQGTGYRVVKRGTTLLVRHDITQPNSYQVSFMGGQGDKEQVFELTKSEWQKITSKLRAYEPKA